jgi:hypothetical protein
MTPAQRAAFEGAFTRGEDGKYTMNESVRSSASNAARYFGTMHNNDATQMRNFLGAHGGGGNRQLMLTPDVNALSSYLATTTNARGQQVRQYDYVDELQRATITPEREREIAAIRATEDRGNLNANENARVQALSENTGGLKSLSDRFAEWTARNPLGSSLATAAVLPALGAAAKGAGALLGTTSGSAGAGVLAVLGAGVANLRTAITGKTLAGDEVGTARRVASVAGVANPLVGMMMGAHQGAEVLAGYLATAIRGALEGTTLMATTDPHTAEHLASQGASSGRTNNP